MIPKKTFRKKTLWSGLHCLAFVAGLPAAQAQARIEEVIVTAQKQEETLQTVPMAITALTAADLEKSGATSFEGIAGASPSVAFTPYSGSSNMLVLYMRGQGVIDPGQITTDGSIGLYTDGFYIARPQATTFDFGDIERVEVLRGPQGTLYGRNTTGGAINLISKKPSGEFGFKQTLTFGSRDLFRSVTTVDLPAWGNVATKFTLLKSAKNGYVKNTGDSHDFGEEAQRAGRFALHWDASAVFSVDYFAEAGSLDSTPVYYENDSFAGLTVNGYPYPVMDGPASHTFRPIDLPLSTSRFETHGLTLSWDVSDTLTIKSLTGYRKLVWDAYQDYANAFSAAPLVPVDAVFQDLVHDHHFSQELQFVGDLPTAGITYVAGLYYFSEGADHYQTVRYPAFGVNKIKFVDAESTSKAAFGQLTWTPPILDDRLDLTFGARYTEDKRSADRFFSINGAVLENGAATGAVNDQKFSRFNPSFTAAYNWADDFSTYAKVATGYKAGGSSETGPLGSFNLTFAPEKVTSYEVGLKSYWFDQRLRVNVAAFASTLEDVQLSLPVDPADLSVIQGYNAGKVTADGVEVELLFVPIEDLSLSLNYSYLDAKVKRIDIVPGTTFDPSVNPASPYQLGDNAKGVINMPQAPRDTVYAAADYTFFRFGGGDLSAHLDYRFQSRMYLSSSTGPDVPNADYFSIPSYGVLNGRITLALDLPRGDRARISVWGKNLLEKEYPLHVIASGGGAIPVEVGGVVTDAGYTSRGVAWAEPATYGIDLVYEY